jgi:hypothetical protein
MLIRSVFELPDPDNDSLGVEGDKTSSADRSKLWDIVAVLFIKGKVMLTGWVFKQITAQVAPYDVATWIKPYTGTMLAAMLWDSMICHAIMQRIELRAIGVTTSVEVFNELFDRFC